MDEWADPCPPIDAQRRRHPSRHGPEPRAASDALSCTRQLACSQPVHRPPAPLDPGTARPRIREEHLLPERLGFRRAFLRGSAGGGLGHVREDDGDRECHDAMAPGPPGCRRYRARRGEDASQRDGTAAARSGRGEGGGEVEGNRAGGIVDGKKEGVILPPHSLSVFLTASLDGGATAKDAK